MSINRSRSGLAILSAVFVALLAHACDRSGSSSPCDPGELRLCECASGHVGRQACSSNERWDDCECVEIGEDTDPGPDSDVDDDIDTDVDIDTDIDTDADTDTEPDAGDDGGDDCLPDDVAACDAEYGACQIECGDDAGPECFDDCFEDYCECITGIGCDPADYDCP